MLRNIAFTILLLTGLTLAVGLKWCFISGQPLPALLCLIGSAGAFTLCLALGKH